MTTSAMKAANKAREARRKSRAARANKALPKCATLDKALIQTADKRA